MASETDMDEEGSTADLFQEPEGFYQPDKEPTYAKHVLLSGKELRVRLVGFNPLWVSIRLSHFLYFTLSVLHGRGVWMFWVQLDIFL